MNQGAKHHELSQCAPSGVEWTCSARVPAYSTSRRCGLYLI